MFTTRFRFTKALLIFSISMLIYSCKEDRPIEHSRTGDASLKESLIKANQYLMRNEVADIEAYIQRHNLMMTSTSTGLRYAITRHGKGIQPHIGNTVTIEYAVSLINGEKIYDSGKDGVKTFVLGKSDEISGLEEGIFLLRQGDQAKFIIPSHLAFGLAGDDKKVPKRASLVYSVKLILVK